jgi:hypothetical protein
MTRDFALAKRGNPQNVEVAFEVETADELELPDATNYYGPMEMYRRSSFETFRQLDSLSIVRKAL